jgi:putative transposase
MSIRKINFIENEFYHIYNRGNSKQIIFKDQTDYKHFQSLLYICNSPDSLIARNHMSKDFYQTERSSTLVAIGAYVQMSNHFHIVLTPVIENGVSLFMQKVSTAYSMYFNKKYNRTGGLFEGKFKAQYAGSDVYLKYLFAYIHLNPVKTIDPTWKELGLQDIKKTLEFMVSYSYSSYLDYKGISRVENSILDTSPFPHYFPESSSLDKEILSWLLLPQE